MVRAIVFAIIGLLCLLGLTVAGDPAPLLIETIPARSKVQQPMCVAPWLWSHTCDGRGCLSRNPRSIA